MIGLDCPSPLEGEGWVGGGLQTHLDCRLAPTRSTDCMMCPPLLYALDTDDSFRAPLPAMIGEPNYRGN